MRFSMACLFPGFQVSYCGGCGAVRAWRPAERLHRHGPGPGVEGHPL